MVIVMKTVLLISALESTGADGMAAEIKTLTAHGVYATCAVTQVTAINTVNVGSTVQMTPEFICEQIDKAFDDIPPDAVKIGMLPSPMHIYAVGKKLMERGAKNIVIDPVMFSGRGSKLVLANRLKMLTRHLLPICTVVTPNTKEAEAIISKKIYCKYDMSTAAQLIGNKYECSVLITGGFSILDTTDLLYSDGNLTWFNSKAVATANALGTGCLLSTAIAANLAKGMLLEQAVAQAKQYVTGSLSTMLDLGKGEGPADCMFDLRSRFI